MKNRAERRPRAARYFPSLSHPADIASNVHMFTEDLRLGVMPIGGRTHKNRTFTIQFEGMQDDKQRAIEICRSIGRDRYRGHDPTAVVCDAVNEIAQCLTWYGRAVYEIVREEDRSIFSLYSFTTQRLFKIFRFYIQWIPSADQKVFKKRLVVLPSRDVWNIGVPKILGGTKSYQRTLSKLRRFHTTGPEFWRSDLQAQRQSPGFNFQDYVQAKKVRDSRLTKRWGWNRRDTTLNHTTEFFYFYRTITFNWAKALLREHIIDQLNRLFVSLLINSKIVVSGLPLPDEILEVRRKMALGNIPFGKAYDLTTA